MSPGKVVLQAQTWWKSKTIWLGVAMVVLGVLDYVMTLDLPPEVMPVLGAVSIALRAVTSRPITSSPRPKYVQLQERVDPPQGRGTP